MQTINKINIALTSILILAISMLSFGPVISVGAQEAPPAAPAGSTVEQRIEQRKAERAVALTEKEVQRLTNTCTSAQAKIRALQQKTTTSLDKRAKLYAQIDARLWVAIGKLKLSQKDTFEFEKTREGLKAQFDQFNETGQSYKQSLDDSAVINCKADPTGFKSLVETAKLYNADMRAQSSSIRDTIVNEVKPAFNDFTTQLKGGDAQSTGEGE